MNREGLTWREWCRAAGVDASRASVWSSFAFDAWLAGDDPTEWRAFPEWPGSEFSDWNRHDARCEIWFEGYRLGVPRSARSNGNRASASPRAVTDHEAPVGVP